MSSSAIVVLLVRKQNVAQMPFAKDHNVIKAFSSNRADQGFAVSILPWRARSCRLVTNAHGANAPFEDISIGSVAVADKICRWLFPAAGFVKLAGDPSRRGMRCYAHPQHSPSIVAHYQQAIEQSKRERWDDEEVHRCDAIGVIAQKSPPSLRRRLSAFRHIFSDRSLPDLDPELEELSMNAWRAP